VSPFCISTDCSISIDKPEEPVENSKNILTAFDGGFSLSKPLNNDNRTPTICNFKLTSGYLATLFSPNLIAHAALHASGRVELYPMTVDPTSSLISVVLAQKFTLSVKKHSILEDIYIVLEPYLNDGPPLLPSTITNFRTGDEIDAPGFTVLWVQIRFVKGVTHGPSP
jgi:hypothetical protein